VHLLRARERAPLRDERDRKADTRVRRGPERRLLAGLAGESNARLDQELHARCAQTLGERASALHREHDAEVPHTPPVDAKDSSATARPRCARAGHGDPQHGST
jgi:hypothetical protein